VINQQYRIGQRNRGWREIEPKGARCVDDSMSYPCANRPGSGQSVRRQCRTFAEAHLALPLKTLTRRFGSTVSGFRYYSPSMQRWVNRDPIADPAHEALRTRSAVRQALGRDAQNREWLLYSFVGNSPLEKIDPDGRKFVVGPGSGLVNNWYKCQGVLGVLVMLADLYFLSEACDHLGYGESLLLQTAGSRVMTIPNMAAIIAYCNGPGVLAYNVNKDEAGKCTATLVVVCLASGEA
jgi:RHS repeat-associated protein